MKKILFRVDGGSNIGMGHIMRCISLGVEFRKKGCKVFFLSKFDKGINKILEKNFHVIKLDKGENELKNTVQNIKCINPDLLIIDTYNVDEKYFNNLRLHVKKIAYIDDLNKFKYPVDILINGNITGNYLGYEKHHEGQIMLLGIKYNLIRDEFKHIKKKQISNNIKSILITTGATDPYNMSIKLIDILMKHKEMSKINIHIVVGSGFNNKGELRKIDKKNSNIIIHEDVRYMSEIMLSCDMAISAGGSTLYELCRCGVPTMSFIMVDNQEELVKKMNELGFIKSLGWHFEIDEKLVLSNISKLMNSYKERVNQIKKIENLVDGNGTSRIIDEIFKII